MYARILLIILWEMFAANESFGIQFCVYISLPNIMARALFVCAYKYIYTYVHVYLDVYSQNEYK